jgi:hypothetical protein
VSRSGSKGFLARLSLMTAACVTGIAACTIVSTDPNLAVAIEIDSTQLPAIILGDSLRDSLGNFTGITARAFNSNNELLSNPTFQFLTLDTASRVLGIEPATGHLFGQDTGTTQLVASIGNLQSERITVHVTLRPDTVFRVDTLSDTLHVPASLLVDSSFVISVKVQHRDDAGDTVGVQYIPVHFRVTSPADWSPSDSSHPYLVNDANSPSTEDTTGSDGVASRRLRLPLGSARSTLPESMDVLVTALRPVPLVAGFEPIPGGPFTYHFVFVQDGALTADLAARGATRRR